MKNIKSEIRSFDTANWDGFPGQMSRLTSNSLWEKFYLNQMITVNLDLQGYYEKYN